MKHSDEAMFTIAEMVFDARAAGDAALWRDFDESRFRAHILMGKAYALGFTDLALAAAALEADLGPPGTEPGTAYGASMVLVAEEINAVCRHR